MRFYEILQLLEVSDKVKNLMRNKFQKQDPNLTDDQINYYLDRWDRFSKTLPADKRDITRLTFDQMEQLIDAAEAKQAVKGKRAEPSDPIEGEIYNKNNLVIYKGDSRPKCIQYGQGYKWCISRRDGGNLYTRYRFRGDEPIFYFVFDKDRDQEDDLHAVVIYVNKNNKYWLAKSINDGDEPVSWEQIVSKMPKLEPLKSLFKPQPTPEEQADFDKYGRITLTPERFEDLTYAEKVKYIDYGKNIFPEQQDKLPYELLAMYAKQSPDTLSMTSWNRLKFGDFKYAYNSSADTIPSSFFYNRTETETEKEARIANKEWFKDPKKNQYAVSGIVKEKPELTTDAKKAFMYANWLSNGPWPPGEEAIAKDAEWAYYYAKDVLKPAGIKRFIAGEKAIAKDPEKAYWYARYVLKGPFPAGEPAIAKKYADDYVQTVLEPAGITDFTAHAAANAKKPDKAYIYAHRKGPWPAGSAGEAVIAKDPKWAYRYAENILKGPFPAGEEAIAKDNWSAYHYALFVLKPAGIKRWPDGEKAIVQSDQTAFEYARIFNLDYDQQTKTFKEKAQ